MSLGFVTSRQRIVISGREEYIFNVAYFNLNQDNQLKVYYENIVKGEVVRIELRNNIDYRIDNLLTHATQTHVSIVNPDDTSLDAYRVSENIQRGGVLYLLKTPYYQVGHLVIQRVTALTQDVDFIGPRFPADVMEGSLDKIHFILQELNDFVSDNTAIAEELFHLVPEELGELKDVEVDTAVQSHVLYFDGTNWIAKNISMTEIRDVVLNNVDDNEILAYVGGIWTNKKVSELTVPIPQVLNDLNDVIVAGANPTNILYFDGNVWVAASIELEELSNVNFSALQNTQVLTYMNGTWTNKNVEDTIPTIPKKLDDLGDVVVSNAVDTNILYFNGTEWIGSHISFEQITDVNLTILSNGQVLTYMNGDWTNKRLEDLLPTIPQGLDDLSDVELGVATEDHVLTYRSGSWRSKPKDVLTPVDIKTLYESNVDTNAFLDIYKQVSEQLLKLPPISIVNHPELDQTRIETSLPIILDPIQTTPLNPVDRLVNKELATIGLVYRAIDDANDRTITETAGFTRNHTNDLGIIELCRTNGEIESIDQDGNFTLRTDGLWADGTPATPDTFALIPSGLRIVVYINSVKKLITDKITVALPSTPKGIFYIYLKDEATLGVISTITKTHIRDTPVVASFTAGHTERKYLTDWRLGINMSTDTKYHLIRTESTHYISGLGITGLVEHGQTFQSVLGGTTMRVDLELEYPEIFEAPFAYIDGVEWYETPVPDNKLFLLESGNSHISYNYQFEDGTWELRETPQANDAVITFFLLLNTPVRHVVKIVGQNVYKNVNQARDNIVLEINGLVLSKMPLTGATLIGAVIGRGSNSLQLVNGDTYVDLRDSVLGGGTTSSTLLPNNLYLTDGSRTMEATYSPTEVTDLTTKKYVDNIFPPDDAILTDGSNQMDSGYTPASDLNVATKKYVDDIVSPTNAYLTDGSKNMDSGYTPADNLSLTTKEYVDGLIKIPKAGRKTISAPFSGVGVVTELCWDNFMVIGESYALFGVLLLANDGAVTGDSKIWVDIKQGSGVLVRVRETTNLTTFEKSLTIPVLEFTANTASLTVEVTSNVGMLLLESNWNTYLQLKRIS